MVREQIVGPGGKASKKKASKKKATRKKVPAKKAKATSGGTSGGADDLGAIAPGRTEVQSIAVAKINPAPYNPRVALQPGDADYEKLKRSIETYALVEPLIWNRQTGNLVGGHQRLAVLLNEYDIDQVSCVVVDLGLAEEKALNIALNKVQGRWDELKLAELLDELKDTEGLDLELTGFDASELESLHIDFDGPGDDGDNAGDGDGADGETAGGDEAPGTQETAGEVRIAIGEYAWMVERQAYDAWLDELRESAAFAGDRTFESGEIIGVLHQRLGFKTG